MLDIKMIRENPDAFDAALAKRGLAPQAEALIAQAITQHEMRER